MIKLILEMAGNTLDHELRHYLKAIPHKGVGAEANEFFVRCNGRF